MIDIKGGEEIPKDREGVEILLLSPRPSGTCTAGEFAKLLIVGNLRRPNGLHLVSLSRTAALGTYRVLC